MDRVHRKARDSMNVANQKAIHVYVYRMYPNLPERVPTSGITRVVVHIWHAADMTPEVV